MCLQFAFLGLNPAWTLLRTVLSLAEPFARGFFSLPHLTDKDSNQGTDKSLTQRQTVGVANIQAQKLRKQLKLSEWVLKFLITPGNSWYIRACQCSFVHLKPSSLIRFFFQALNLCMHHSFLWILILFNVFCSKEKFSLYNNFFQLLK